MFKMPAWALIAAMAMISFAAAASAVSLSLTGTSDNVSDQAKAMQQSDYSRSSYASPALNGTPSEEGQAGYDSYAWDDALSNRSKVVPAAELLYRARSGEPIDYENVSIVGDLDLSQPEIQFTRPFKIANSTIFGHLDFSGATFTEPVAFRFTTFAGDATFKSAQFLEDVSFAKSVFTREADFSVARFGGIANFTEARFEGETRFSYAQFGSLTYFPRVRFDDDVHLDFSQFSRLAIFWNALFSGNTDFSNAHFMDKSNFLDADFAGNVSFAATRFDGDVVFWAAWFRGNAIFGLAYFGGFSDFQNTRFDQVAYFPVAKFTDTAFFMDAIFKKDLVLESARIYSMIMENVTFGPQSTIVLKGADFNRFTVHWDVIKDRMKYDGAAYIALTNNYKDLEWFDDADECYYQYRFIGQQGHPWGWSKIFDIIAWISCGYGVRVSYVSFWCIFTIIFFGVVFWAGNGMGKFEVTGLEVPGNADVNKKRISLIDALYFSTAMFTTSQAPVNNYPVGFYRHLAMVEGILGWFFLGLFIVVLSGVLIR
jgi:uncharacterized protein YjbI with pentapeptide repeats